MDPGQAFSYFFSVGLDIMAAQLDKTSNAIRFQAGDSVKQTAYSNSAEVWQQPGFASIPSPPSQGQHGCQGLALKHSDRDMFFAFRDVRAAQIYGSLKYGETCLYGTGVDGKGTPRFFIKQDGSLTRYCQTGNVASGQSIADAISPTGWSVGTPWGAVSLSSSGLSIALPGGSGLQVDTEGHVTIVGAVSVAINGASVSLGAGATELGGIVTYEKLLPLLTALEAFATGFAALTASPAAWTPALLGPAAALGAALAAIVALAAAPPPSPTSAGSSSVSAGP